MFQFFRRLIARASGRADGPAPAPAVDRQNSDDFARLNSQVPLHGANDAHKAFVRREAILNRAEKIAGYEFSLLTSLEARRHGGAGAARRAYDAVLLARLALHRVASLLGHRLAVINVSAESLDDPSLAGLPPENTVLILDAADLSTDRESLLPNVETLRAKGFSFGLRFSGQADLACPMLEFADFIQIDVPAFDGLDLRALTRTLEKPRAGKRKLKLIARDVQSHDDFQFCSKCGFELFQGAFISSRESLRPSNGKINRAVVLPILGMVNREQNFSVIADRLKNEPTMTYKLLRYLNSAAVGLQKPIDNLTEALVLLGRDKFYRWTSLLLFDVENPGYPERILAERALTRGRTLELLAGKGELPREDGHLFLVGLFSLLDQALGSPLPELIEKAALPDVVRLALLGHDGPYRRALELVAQGESEARTSPEQMAEALHLCGIDAEDYANAAARAVDWACRMLGEVAE